MFNRDKGEAANAAAVNAAAAWRAQVESDLTELDNRVQTLESLARQLRRPEVAQAAHVAAAPAVQDDTLTRTEALHALNALRTAGAAEFERLHAQVTHVASVLADGAGADATDVQSPAGIDYGAVAFGLKEISRKVGNALGGSAGDPRTEYAGAVQYFADVFMKADPQFDADAFKRQSGV